MARDMSASASQNRLKLTTFKLNALLGMAQAISAELKTEEILDRFRVILNDDFGIDRILLYKKEETSWELLLNSNCPLSTVKQIVVERDLLPCQEITFVGATESPALLELDIIIPIIQNNVSVGYVLIGDTNEYGKGVSTTIRHLNFVQTLSIIIFVAIENLRLFHKSLQQEAMRKELELASKMQNMLIPSPASMPRYENITISSFYNPHFEVGGDYYDVIPLNSKEFGFCMSDVSGKGISAALLMSNFQANLRALFTADIPLTKLVEKLNERVMASAKGEKFITIFVGRYNTESRCLEYVNAGHNPPVLFQKESRKVAFLNDGCMGLGMLDDIPLVKLGKVPISEPTRLICYTDGLVESVQNDEVEYDTRIVEEFIGECDSIKDSIGKITEARGIGNKNSQSQIFDDISILGFEFL